MDDLTERIVGLSPTKRALLELRLKKNVPSAPSGQTIPPRAESDSAPLSFAQQRLWFLDQLEPDSFLYHVPRAIRINGALKVEALHRTLETIVARHEVLRTTFATAGGNPVQVISPTLSMPLPVEDLSELSEPGREAEALRLTAEEAQRPFDLARGPLLRANLLRLGAEEHILLLNMHHIVSDGWSHGVFVRELTALYEAFSQGNPSPLEELPIQYADYALWQREWLQGEVLEEHLGYWKQRLTGAPAMLELPTDRPRPAVQSYRGALHPLVLSKSLSESLKVLSQREGVTLFMTLLAAFQTLLARYTGQEDIVVGTDVANRTRVETEGLIGFFVNALVLRTDLSGDPSFRELLSRVREVTLGAYEHQDLPFEKLVEELRPERSLSRAPLFQMMFTMQNAPRSALELSGLVLCSMEVDRETAKFDLALFMSEQAEGLEGAVEYSSDLFDAATIARMLLHFQVLLEAIVADPEQRLSALPLLTDAERHQLLVEWNDTWKDYPQDQCLHELFEAQVEQTPEAVAVVFEQEQLTYRELNARANHVAHHLRSLGVRPEVLVGIMLERSIEMVVGLLGILKAGGAYVPLDATYPQERLAFMLEDAAVPVLLTEQRLLESVSRRETEVVCLDADWEQIAQESAGNPNSGVAAENLAYVIYTSGSTGKPKGAMNTHRGICNRLLWMQDAYQLTEADRVLQKTPFSFDVSVWEFFWPLLIGARLVVARPGGHQDSAYLVDLIRAQQITTLHFVPSMLQVFLEERGLERCTSLKQVMCSGEALPFELQERFFARLNAALHNLYGPTEAAVDVTFWECERESGLRIVPIGRPIANTQLYVLDRHLNPEPVGVPGELYIGGAGLARGYLNRPELTAERFIPNPFSREPGARLYRTGDLARYLADGNIEYLGRLDHQVKIRGYRIELGEIEAVLVTHPQVREAVVVAREDEPGDRRLVAYVVVEEEQSPGVSELRHHLKAKLPEYMVPAVFMMLDQMPLSPNGKVDRRALPAPDQARPDLAASYVAPRTATEEVMEAIWAEVLGLEPVGINDNFFELGGHSLLATQVMSRVRTAFEMEVPLRVLFEDQTVAALAARIEAVRQTEHGVKSSSMARVPRDREIPLSFAQRRLWFLNLMEPDSSFYNMPQTIRMSGVLNIQALHQTLNAIAARHEILRTTFAMVDGSPVQVIAPTISVPLPVIDLSELPEAQREAEMLYLATEEAQRSFDLTRGPLLRAKLLWLGADEHILLLTLHHIIGDGWSFSVLIRELMALYEAFLTGKPSLLPELTIQYADFTVWQRQWLRGELHDRQLSYWEKQLDGLPQLELPTDRPRPTVQSFRGARQPFALSASLTKKLKTLSRQESATLFMTLLAAFQTLLARYTGQEDIVVGSPIANRNRAEIEGLIGFLVNTLALRTDLSGNPTFRELLGRVREVALGAYTHQDLPFEKLVEELQPERNLSHNPLFQVMFALQNAPSSTLELEGLTLHSLEIDRGIARFDLTLFIWEQAETLHGTVEYSTDLFDAATIRRMLGHFQVLLEGIVAHPDQHLSALPLLTDAERHQLLVEWNNTRTDYPKDQCVHELFEAQARKSPEAVAVIFEDEQMTYDELNRRANQLAHYLRWQGVGPEVRVGIALERSIEMVVGLLGILKAGGAYVPLDPAYPAERLRFMLADAEVPVLVTQASLVKSLPEHGAAVVCLDADWERIAKQSEENVTSRVGAENLAYVIYTSGSTGQPKGVAVMHRSVVRLIKETNYVHLASNEVFLQFAPISFDASTFELWGCLLNGARLVVFSAHTPSLEELGRALRRYQVTTLWLTAGLFHQMVGDHLEGLRGVRQLLAGGDVLSVPHVERVLQELRECRLINGYGPTENTTFTCCYTITSADGIRGSVPIGRPIANTQVYVLDQHMNPVPIGVAGELYIGGDGLARCYLNRPDLTAEKFIADPFSEEPEARLYNTGDLVRYLPDSNIEFLGRIDHQVKIRGFRIELEEIETVLAVHPAVEQAVVLAREDEPGDKRLVAYVTQNPQYQHTADAESGAEMQAEQVAQWQTLYEDLYHQDSAQEDTTFNTIGWNSSYTGEPIPAPEMREWVEHTVERVLRLNPRRVLEIGCGTGLLLFQIASHCQAYHGTDFSQAVLDKLARQVEAAGLKQVRLSQQEATDFAGIEAESYDTVVINSVVQYFPSIDYLVQVLEGAVNAVAPGGAIFVGDVRNFELLEAFHASVELYRAPSSLTSEQLRQHVQSQVTEEDELVIAPSFFSALKKRLPKISRVEVEPKRGWAENELTKYRYGVTLHISAAPQTVADVEWLQWDKQKLSLKGVRRMLEESAPDTLGIARVPNARVLADARITELLANQETLPTAGELREALEQADGKAVNPEEFWSLSEQLPYEVEMSWAGCDQMGRYDVAFRRRAMTTAGAGEEAPRVVAHRAIVWPDGGQNSVRPWSYYANQPLAKTMFRSVVPKLRSYLQEKLPEYMVPSAFVLLDELPLTPNGKVDRRALPAPDRTRPDLEAAYVAPRTAVEEVLAGVWAEVLDVERVGVHDDFFDLGGHSLKATQVVSRVREALQVEMPLRSIFEQPTVAGLAELLLQEPHQRVGIEKTARVLISLAELSEAEVDTMLDEKSLLMKG